jgi:hypothetical protein
MKNVNTMTAEEKKAHLAKIMSRINANPTFQLIDVTPAGYGPDR